MCGAPRTRGHGVLADHVGAMLQSWGGIDINLWSRSLSGSNAARGSSEFKRTHTHAHARTRTHTHGRTHARTHARSHARTHARMHARANFSVRTMAGLC